MTELAFIRLDPAELHRAADEIEHVAEEYRGLAEQAWRAAQGAPSYEGQFGPKVWVAGDEAHARLSRLADRLSSLGVELLARADAFEVADLESQAAFQRLASTFQDWTIQISHFGPLSRPANLIGVENLIYRRGDPEAGGEDGDRSPWWAPVVSGTAQGWFDLDEKVLRALREYLHQIPATWDQNLEYIRIVAAFYSAQTQAWLDQHVGQPIDELMAKLPAFQEPGLPPDGPLTPALTRLAIVDSQGAPVSPVGYELVQLIDARGGVTVIFADELTAGGNAGVTPTRGMIWLPDRYRGALMQEVDPALVGHELAHVLQRDLPEFPDGTPTLIPLGLTTGSWPFGPQGLQPFSLEHGAPLIGDFTLYMEVQSNIVDKAIQYDLLSHELAGLTPGTPEYTDVSNRMVDIANRLATYTGDAREASVFVVQDYGAHGMYAGELVREVILGARIPEGGWQYWLGQQGFSDVAVQHIQDVSSRGVAQPVYLAGILDEPSPLFPTSGSMPTAAGLIPTPGPSPAPTPEAAATPAPTSTPAPPQDVHPD